MAAHLLLVDLSLMASVYLGDVCIDYSVVDGHVRGFSIGQDVLYDEDQHIEIPRWKSILAEIVKCRGLNRRHQNGPLDLHEFVYWLESEGELIIVRR